MADALTNTKLRPWLAFYPKDWLADTLHLSALEQGAYLLLLCHYWVHGGLPDDEAMLQRIARLSPQEWSEHQGNLAAFFKGGWVHSRIEREMAEARAKYEKRASAGRCGGKASGISRRSSSETGEAMLQQCSSNAEAKTNHPHPQYSVAKATGASAPPVPSAIPAASDWRSLLFRDGLSIVVGMTGKTEAGTRALIGRWLKASRDDCRQVLRVIEDARETNPADPVAWIEAALSGPRKPRTDSMAFVMARA
jgi:uncharacterized protein YdaU (DUF1376 family)